MSSLAATAAASVAHEGTRLTKGRVGMTCFICTESAFFCTFIVAYLFYIGKDVTGPTPEETLRLGPIIVNSICLLSSSLTIVLATRALARGRIVAFGWWLLLTILLGLEFLIGTALEWKGLIEDHGLTIATNLFGSTFYSLIGFHAGHVTLGLIMLTTILIATVRGAVHAGQRERVELVSWYWHFVDCIWIVVFTVVYIIGR